MIATRIGYDTVAEGYAELLKSELASQGRDLPSLPVACEGRRAATPQAGLWLRSVWVSPAGILGP